MDDLSLNGLRIAAKRMQRAHAAGEAWAVERLKQYGPGKPAEALVRADFLHAVAREAGFESWPRLKAAAEAMETPVTNENTVLPSTVAMASRAGTRRSPLLIAT